MADIQSGRVNVASKSLAWALISVFTISIFLSATLLFSVQPMFAKLVLPLLGGSSNVWNTAMVFFQVMLLGGYIYAHLISRYLSFSVQILVHTFVLSAGLVFLPLAVVSGWTPPSGGAQAYWLIGLFAVSVGVPFFAISANAPLLQRWFSRTDDKNADDPYFLYSASNAGSLLSLCFYPVLFEPILRLGEQTALWANGYRVLIIVILAAGILAYLNRKVQINQTVEITSEDNTSINMNSRFAWVALAFIPSSLMLGVTSYMTNDIASAPMLWIIPLALYLLTFIFVFAKKPIFTSQRLGMLFPWIVLFALGVTQLGEKQHLLAIGLSLICYFIISLMSHARLVEARPSAKHLTEFYIWMSFGGVLGGAFNALLAPMIFNGVYEYVFVLLAAFFLKPGIIKSEYLSSLSLKASLIYLALGIEAFILFTIKDTPVELLLLFMGTGFLLFCTRLGVPRLKLAYISAALLVFMVSFPETKPGTILKDRSFFGVIKVVTMNSKDLGLVNGFYHGSTLHNFQFHDESLRRIPLAYYAEGGTFDSAVQLARSSKPYLNITMIGLGAGAMACYEQAADNWIYMEIDPVVVDMATNPKYFSYMKDCSFKSDIRIGDARLTMHNVPEGSQDLILVDAFSSDSIPAHLVTREAMALYQSRLKEDGLIFFHTSNRMLDVSSVIVNLAQDAGLDSRFMRFKPEKDAVYRRVITNSDGVLVGSNAAMQKASVHNTNWKRYMPSPDVGVWSDDYSHILGTIIAHKRKNAEIIDP